LPEEAKEALLAAFALRFRHRGMGRWRGWGPVRQSTHISGRRRSVSIDFKSIRADQKYTFSIFPFFLRLGDVFACFMPVWASFCLKYYLNLICVWAKKCLPIRTCSKQLPGWQ
jgi:hypothetical protein